MKPILFVSGRTSPNPKDPKDSIKAHSFVYVTNSLHDCGKCPRYLGLSFLICKQAIRLIVAFNYETVNEFFVTPPPLPTGLRILWTHPSSPLPVMEAFLTRS